MNWGIVIGVVVVVVVLGTGAAVLWWRIAGINGMADHPHRPGSSGPDVVIPPWIEDGAPGAADLDHPHGLHNTTPDTYAPPSHHHGHGHSHTHSHDSPASAPDTPSPTAPDTSFPDSSGGGFSSGPSSFDQ